MSDEIKAGIVSVLNANGQIVGTGFVAGPRLILTCAHVVKAAGQRPGEAVTVCFEQNYERRLAQVAAEYWRPPEQEDVATLILDADLPAAVSPLPIGDSVDCVGHTFRTFGYVVFGNFVGLRAAGPILGEVRKTDGRRFIQLQSQDVSNGMSGAPVWDEIKKCVIGMVTAGSDPNKLTPKHRDLALATPSETLRAVCPILQFQSSNPPSLLSNPFFTGGRIHDPGQFFGRERLVREIRGELNKRSSVSLVGESQMGKSSLLYYLYATRADWLPEVTVEYLDLQRVLDEQDFCESVLGKLGMAGDSLRQLKKVLETRAVVLLFDEVERIAAPDFNPRLHDLLRSLAQEPHFAMCLSSQHSLESIFPAQMPGAVSAFHNIFTRKFIGTFTPEEARAFLAARLANTGAAFTGPDIERLLAESHCHPAHLQRLAKELFDERQRIASHNG